MTEFAVDSLPQSDGRTPTRWVLSHLAHHKLIFLGVFVGAFGNAALAAAVPVLVGVAFNAVLAEPPDTNLLAMAAVGIIFSQSTRAVLQFGRNLSSAVLGERFERDMRRELYVKLLGKSMAFHDMQPVGDTMARATNDVHEINLMFNPGINLVIGSANFMLMPLLIAPRYNPLLIIAPLFFIISYVLALVRYLGKLSPVADDVRGSFGIMNSRLAESIDGIELVKSVASEESEIELFEQKAHDFRDAMVAQGRIEARFLPLLLLGLTFGLGFALALWLFGSGAIDAGDVIAYMGLLALFGFPTFISLMAYSRVSLGLAGARRVLELINAQTTLDENAGGHQGQITGAIRMTGVSFSYGGRVQTLEDIDFEITPGQTVALVGQTGSGKSSLTKLINRTYDTDDGTILIDGVDVRDWNLATLRRQISIIEQDIFLFSRSVADNIAFGCPGAARETIIQAAKAAQAHEFILNFKDGYETVIGERGVTLSGGQRQRLALARAFLTQPRILILDDSTSAVDSATEDQIQRAIVQASANQTTILITHRLSQIRWADQVLVLRKGSLVAKGTHDELMSLSPAYRRIFDQYEAMGV